MLFNEMSVDCSSDEYIEVVNNLAISEEVDANALA